MSRTAFRAGQSPRDHYAEVTNKVTAMLETGAPPWRRPWDKAKAAVCGSPALVLPRNAVTGARYSGINLLVLALSQFGLAGGDPRWATYRQAQQQGWQVRRGEQGTPAYFFKRLEVRDGLGAIPRRHGSGADGRQGSARGDVPGRERAGDDGVRHIPLLRSFTLFHASQIEGIGPYRLPTPDEAPWRTPEAVDVIVANSGAEVRYGGSRAFYSVATDRIQLPRKATFRSAGALAGTTLHELAHWSGAGHRLGRNLTGEVGSEAYAREECRAEMAACLASAELGIEGVEFDNSAAYVADWLADLRRDKKEVFRAAADAQRIADYLLAFHPDWATRNGKAGSADGSASEDAEEGAPLREAA